MIANNVTNGRTIGEASQILRLAKEIAGTVPKFVVTDGLNSYEQALKDEYHTHKYWLKGVQHIRLETIRKKPDNNLVERFHGTFRQRDKTMRGFKGREQVFSTGFRNYYNFIRPHTTLGATPAASAGIDLQLGRNRWMGLLRKTEM
ncbi:MAG: DDE-type integrase/transposase/recombinase [Candidatus Aenigmarchaeota archaeon]|nr:DDE-type integrase/transposase/recombinase [Candidatus Aenigmarchaeota archaeon]